MNKLYAYKVTLTRPANGQLQYDTIEPTTDIPSNVEAEYNKIIMKEDKRMKQHRINKYIIITEKKCKRLTTKNVVAYYIHNEPFTLNNLPTVIDTINKIVTKDIKRLGFAYEDNQMDYYMKLSMNALIENYVKYRIPEVIEIKDSFPIMFASEDTDVQTDDEYDFDTLELNAEEVKQLAIIANSSDTLNDKLEGVIKLLKLDKNRIQYFKKYYKNRKVLFEKIKKYAKEYEDLYKKQ